MKNNVKTIIALVLCSLVPIINGVSQPAAPDPGFSPGAITQLNCTSVPVGDGTLILFALAIGYSLYLTWKSFKPAETL